VNIHASDRHALAGTRPWLANRDYAPETARLLAEAEDWLPVLRELGLSGSDLRKVVLNAEAGRTSFLSALIDSGLASEHDLTQAMAAVAGADFVEKSSRRILAADADCEAELAKANPLIEAEIGESSQTVTMLLAPRDIAPLELEELVVSAKRHGRRIALLTPTELRRALIQRIAPRLTTMATQGLVDWRPDLSARDRFSPRQAFGAGVYLMLLAMLFAFVPLAVWIGMHLFSTAFFFSCSGIKAAAAIAYVRRKPAVWTLPRDTSELPVYSVLVALHREAEVVPQLLVALGKIVWPRDKLEIKLVCEADDRETIDAIRAHNPRSFVEIIEVPPSRPRTKPKALRFAMALTTGEFIVLYDAEDRPHPGQLLESYARFRSVGSKVVCLQAPLQVTNGARSVLARMFAFEYAGLFRAVLPWLAARRQVLPLGGTSNHFRRAALEEIGSWDPHNVTEDADVGVRLFRSGYRAETITLPTLEAAPEEISVWVPQRTRWLKGWLQTWLVHMRQPSALLGEVGLSSFLLVQVLLAGMFFSALLHPIIFMTAIGYSVWSLMGFPLASWQLWLLAVDYAILLFSYATFLLLGWRTLSLSERAGFPVVVLMTPAYWLLTSYAAWLALIEFVRHPHRWNKTPHRPG
jgi:cellulose synthase/poly-beta-1,6-N-acetylglucosamine synthase-like glycosyltransferase